MAFVAGKDGSFQIDDSGGTLRDISAFVRECDMEDTLEHVDVTALGKGAHQRLATLQDGRFTARGPWDATATTGVDPVLAVGRTVARTIDYFPGGTPVGTTKPRYRAEVYIESYRIVANVDGSVDWEATFVLQDGTAVARAAA